MDWVLKLSSRARDSLQFLEEAFQFLSDGVG